MATWGDQTCQRFEATAVGFETGFSRLRVRPSNRYAIAPHDSIQAKWDWIMVIIMIISCLLASTVIVCSFVA